eukprot:1047312-Pleurochrysis_carterae.AAC.3
MATIDERQIPYIYRFHNFQFIFLSWLEPGERGWIVSTTKVLKLKAQQCQEDNAEALGIHSGAEKPES